MSKQRLAVRLRAFAIWQKLGFLPWSKKKSKSRKGDFYKGAFDTIPFLNDDAKRTFVHLLLRPGYMIRDYIKGQHERYLAPLTSLIIFYAFFALISSIVSPDYSSYHPQDRSDARYFRDSVLVNSARQAERSDSIAIEFDRHKALVKAVKLTDELKHWVPSTLTHCGPSGMNTVESTERLDSWVLPTCDTVISAASSTAST